MLLRAVIFDMDGVLIDTEPHLDAYYGGVLKSLGVKPTADDFDCLRGSNRRSFWTYFVEKYGITYPKESFLDNTVAGFLDYLKSCKSDCIPGVRVVIRKCLRRNLSLAVASSASRSRIIGVLELLKLFGVFSVIVSGQDVVTGKPAPDIFLLAAEKLGVVPENCTVIEDSESGVIAATEAGMKVIGYKSPRSIQDLSVADVVVSSLKDLSINAFY